MSLKIGPVTIEASPSQEAALKPFVEKAVSLIGGQLKPLGIRVKPRAQMPAYRDPRPNDQPGDNKARGFWRLRARRMLLADDLFAPGEPLEETCGHEFVHALFDDDKDLDKRALLEFLDPIPESYADTEVNGRVLGYPGDPEENLCVWGSAAIFGFAKPAYTTLFKRKVSAARLPMLKAMFVRTPSTDPCAAELATVRTQLDAEILAHKETKAAILPLAEQVATDSLTRQNLLRDALSREEQTGTDAVAIVNLARE